MSGLGRYIVDAVVVEHRSPTQLARDHKISKRWIFKLLRRFKEGGYAALEPRSRRPKSCRHQVETKVQELIVKLRAELTAAGHDAGPETIAYHLKGQVDRVPSVATASRALVTVKAADPVHIFHSASDTFGFPASLLSDNAAVFTARSRGGKVLLELELERFGIVFKHSTPYHPQTCGKVERFHQTLKRFLRKQSPARSIAELQFQLDAFRDYYNTRRPHRALKRQTPLAVFNSLLKAKPTMPPAPTDHRVRRDKIDAFGKVTLRYLGRLRHIPVGTAHKNRKVRLLVAGPDVRILTDDGELIRALTLDPTRNYQPLGGRWPEHNVLPQACTMS